LVLLHAFRRPGSAWTLYSWKCLTVILNLNHTGPVSARRLLERVKVAADKGVVWPRPLYALLDDVMARTGRI
jgi:hypothetical protein